MDLDFWYCLRHILILGTFRWIYILGIVIDRSKFWVLFQMNQDFGDFLMTDLDFEDFFRQV